MPRVVVRQASRRDYGELEAIALSAYAQFEGDVAPAVLASYAAKLKLSEDQLQGCEILVCEVDGCTAGSVLYYPDASLEGLGLSHRWAGFRKLAVSPRQRGLGVGRALVQRCIDLARSSGTSSIGIHTASFMRSACRLYEYMGFRRSPNNDLRASDLLGNLDGADNFDIIAYRLDLARAVASNSSRS